MLRTAFETRDSNNNIKYQPGATTTAIWQQPQNMKHRNSGSMTTALASVTATEDKQQQKATFTKEKHSKSKITSYQKSIQNNYIMSMKVHHKLS